MDCVSAVMDSRCSSCQCHAVSALLWNPSITCRAAHADRPKTANWRSNPICMHGQTTACQNPKNEQPAARCMHVIERYATYSLPANAWPLAYCKAEVSCSCHRYKRKTLSLVSMLSVFVFSALRILVAFASAMLRTAGYRRTARLQSHAAVQLVAQSCHLHNAVCHAGPRGHELV